MSWRTTVGAAALVIMIATATWAAGGDTPLGLQGGVLSLSEVDHLVLPGIDIEAVLAEDEVRAREGLPLRFAIPFPVAESVAYSGTWEILAGGDRLWRLRVSSPGADSLNFGFTRFHLPSGARLFIYAADGSLVRGPFTDADNEAHRQFWSPVVPGESAVIELSVPSELERFVELELTAVNHGYRDLAEVLAGEKSGACNIDVVCPQGDDWRDQIRSVAVISIGGYLTCSGFLVNNVREDPTPYFMTAYHCGLNSGTAPSLVVYWNFETSECGGTPDGSLDQFQSGSIWRAGRSASDFTLVELDDAPAESFNVHWTGWDASDAPVSSAVAIHHPNTDEKRISFEYDALQTTSYLGTSVPGDGTHWRVIDWDLGTTEPGSSGSGLWDQNHRVIGQLHGGYAACGNDLSDWYGKFSVSWDAGSSPSQRLRDWLDPDGTGTLVLDGRDQCTPPSVDFTIDPNPAQPGETVQFQSNVSGGTPPYSYAWDVDGDGVTDYTTADATHVYDGFYNGDVTLTVSDGVQCTASATHAMAVDAPSVVWVDHGTPVESCGDGDDVIEPGELWGVDLVVQNVGTVTAENVRAALAVAGGLPNVQLRTPELQFGALAPQEFGQATLIFLIEMDYPPCGSLVPFDITGITWTGGAADGAAGAFTAAVGGASGTLDYLVEDFESAEGWSQWTVTTGPGPHTGGEWTRATSSDQRPPGSTGYYALSDSDGAGSGSRTSTILTSPPMDLSGVVSGQVTLECDLYFRYYEYGGDEHGYVEAYDGASWVTLVEYTSTVSGRQVFDVTDQALQNGEFRIRFSYQDAEYDWWFAVDNVRVTGPADPVCDNVLDCDTGTTPTPAPTFTPPAPTPTGTPVSFPTATPTARPSNTPTPRPTATATARPSATPTWRPTTPPSPTQVPSTPEPTVAPTATAIPTSPPEPTATQVPPTATSAPPTPTAAPPTVTPEPPSPTPALGVSLEMPATYFSPGDECWLNAHLHNDQQPLTAVRLFVVLDIEGQYWFWPSWRPRLDYRVLDVPTGLTIVEIIEPFIWPQTTGDPVNGIVFWGAMLDETMSEVIGSIGKWVFGFGP
jgi:hypothetical protein